MKSSFWQILFVHGHNNTPFIYGMLKDVMTSSYALKNKPLALEDLEDISRSNRLKHE